MHRNARLTPQGRLLLCQRIEGGWPVAHATAAMGISRDRAYVWWHRYQEEGLSRPRGPLVSTASLSDEDQGIDRAASGDASPEAWPGTGPDRRHRAPARLHGPPGARPPPPQPAGPPRQDDQGADPTHRDHDRANWSTSTSRSRAGYRKVGAGGPRTFEEHLGGPPRIGYAYVHSAIDGFSRLAYSEVHPDEQGATAAAFWPRAERFFPSTVSPSSECSATTAAATAPTYSARSSEPPPTPSPGPTDHRPMAKLNASTAPCWRSGPMPGPDRQSGPDPGS